MDHFLNSKAEFCPMFPSFFGQWNFKKNAFEIYWPLAVLMYISIQSIIKYHFIYRHLRVFGHGTSFLTISNHLTKVSSKLLESLSGLVWICEYDLWIRLGIRTFLTFILYNAFEMLYSTMQWCKNIKQIKSCNFTPLQK